MRLDRVCDRERRQSAGFPGEKGDRAAGFLVRSQAGFEFVAALTALGDAVYPNAVVTKIEPARTFYPAEDHHQNFLVRNPTYQYIVHNDLPKIAMT